MLHAVPVEEKPALETGVVAASVYANGQRLADIAVDEAGAWAKRPGHVVWIGLLEPSPELLARVQVQFGLHDLAIEDAGQPHQRPKLEQYGDCVFIVARTAHMLDGRISFGETHIFIGQGYIVSVRHGASTSYAPVRQRAESCPKVLSHGEDYILASPRRLGGHPRRADGRCRHLRHELRIHARAQMAIRLSGRPLGRCDHLHNALRQAAKKRLAVTLGQISLRPRWQNPHSP